MIDLRSDTVTKPTAGMRQAMAAAEVGDDCYAEDPTTKKLEAKVAELLGKEAALFAPTGTMSNQLAIAASTQPGDEVILEAGAHIYNFEGGAMAALSSVQVSPIPTSDGVFTPDEVRARVRPEGDMYPHTSLVCMENTHNRSGGSLWPLAAMRAVADASRALGVRVHLDGARLWNAEVASGTSVKDFAACADSVSVCLSKGLGAPCGSLVAGSAELIKRARKLRRRFGGGMRQSGVLAAAGLYALEHHRSRLAEDHANARRLAAALAKLEGLAVDPERVRTNMVVVRLTAAGADAMGFAKKLREAGVLCNAIGPDTLRLVTHLDVSAAAMDEAARCFERVLV